MVGKDNKLSELALLLKKDDEAVITDAIELLREEEPFSGVIGLLADCYDRNKDAGVARSIENFMNDIKTPSLQKEIIDEIKKERKPATRGMLVSSCWQSGLDYSDYLTDIATVFINCDYRVAIECITLIAESEGISSKTKDQIMKIIDQNPFDPADVRFPLTEELRAALR